MSGPEPQPGGNRLYWQCQLGGWLGLGLFLASPMLLGYSERMKPGVMAAGIALRVVTGLAGTHLLRLYMHRRQWLQQAGGKLVLRLLAGVSLLAAILGGIELPVHRFLLHDDWYRRLDAVRVFQAWAAWMAILVGWTALYIAIREFRGRRRREVRALRLEMMVQEAQLRGLRAQLNPHFLFNCLNSLREVIAEDPERAQRMVTELSALLRYSLESNQAERVPLADEVQAVKAYLALERIRFEERLRVRWSVAPEAAAVRVPPMLLQTLVENAVKHGIARLPQGGEIAIAARCADAELQLEVVNSGRMDGGAAPSGMGLKNAQEMITLLFGTRARLLLENRGEDHVRALVTLPLAPAEAKA
jgi:two-component system sensor histidine kinase AlgZ